MHRLRLALLIALATLSILTLPIACAGPKRVEHPQGATPLSPAEAGAAWARAETVFESRCVVCHGCYDAPCQLKLGTADGIARGATNAKVYDPSRLLPADPTRLDIDAHDAAGWRAKGFHPVLPEGTETLGNPRRGEADPHAALLVRMLDLKRAHPLAALDISKDFTFEIDRKETCATAEKFDDYAKEHPLWGMPYALPGLAPADDAAIVTWVEAGAPSTPPPPLPAPILTSIAAWESFLNDPARKSRLVGRYIYEHLFLASIYFKDVDEQVLFRLVRSRTPAPFPVEEIPTRRPFEDPKVDRVYYRFVRRVEKPLDKTLMPYPLSAARLARFRELFLGRKYEVDRLPGYEPEVGANPFRAFAAIPAEVRYRFMLEEAQFTLMGFIKGPVCRGQVALNVIEDRFWIAFLSPDVPWIADETAFLAGEKQDLDMPAEEGSKLLSPAWLRYRKQHARYVAKKDEFLANATKGGDGVTMKLIWDGDQDNANAALTVFRHFDSATVVKGFVGEPPKTAWVIGYPLLERIHYLLVAGFDVFGNVTHQITTRLYMDFLRMEAESNFLMFLPPAQRTVLIDSWYRDVSAETKAEVVRELAGRETVPNIRYDSADAKRDLLRMIERHLGGVLSRGYDLDREGDPALRRDMERLGQVKGVAASWMPEMSFVTVADPGGARRSFTVLRDSGHTNVMTLFREADRRIKEEDALVVVPGFLGAYPNALFEVPREKLDVFALAVSRLDGPEAYRALRQEFGVLRASDRFWTYSDEIHAEHRKRSAVEAGLFDYGRLEPF